MAFRILVITDSLSFYSDMEAAFEPLSLFLMREGSSLLALAEEDLLTYLTTEKINVVVRTGFSVVDDCTGLQRFIAACAKNAIPVISLSSYRVFGSHQLNGSTASKLLENMQPEPSDLLGQALMTAENIVLEQAQGIVLRVPWSLMNYSQAPEDDGLLDRVCKALLSGNELFVSEEVSGFVISWPEVARVITAMIQQVLCGAESWGVFHLRSSDCCSEAEFTDAVARLLKAEGFNVARLVAMKGAGNLMHSSALLGGRRTTDDFGVQQKSFRIGLKGAVQRWIQLNGYIRALTPLS